MTDMPETFDKILDQCVDRINRGQRVQDCLASYPEHAEELGPLLQSMLDTRTAYTFAPSSETKTAARRRFDVALEEVTRGREERRVLFPRIFGRSKAWVAVAAVLLVTLIGYFGLRPILFPIEPGQQPGSVPVAPAPQPSAEGNFVFLISDEANAIVDFQSLDITISRIGLQPAGETDRWIELDPEVATVDLTLLQGDKAQEIWRGDLPEGRYTKVFIYVSDVSGVLKETGAPVSVNLPSEKLQISKSFQVTSDSVISFVYDVTVVKAGKSGKYNLKPQLGQSGADQKFQKIDKNGNQ